MSTADSTPPVSPTAVRTALSSPGAGAPRCPVCRTVPLTGTRTACSAACRRERSRQRERRGLEEGLLRLRAQVDALLTQLDPHGRARRRR